MGFGPSLFGEKLASCMHNLCWYTCSELLPLGMKWACTCAGKEMWFTHFGEWRWSTVCCFAGLLVVVVLFLLAIHFRLAG